ncbi:hypothetical protein H4R34_003058 [Dimargaris verticillata]|uniref:Neurochondrin-domain-containing protein n=1 Tax=Dimargaris verticillata TaxID=2761393 RepID=A0A9W8EDH9_9FUNG|nr:hypothetical protein H4R34_003058 [Dimargaris verticillata]
MTHSPAVAKCLKLIGPTSTDEEKFAGLLLIPRMFDPNDSAALSQVLDHMDSRFVPRLLHTPADDANAQAYRETALAVIASFCSHSTLVTHTKLSSLVPDLIQLLRLALPQPDQSLVADVLPILTQLLSQPPGLSQVCTYGPDLPLLLLQVLQASVDRSAYPLISMLWKTLLSELPRLSHELGPNWLSVWAQSLYACISRLQSTDPTHQMEPLGALCEALTQIDDAGCHHIAQCYSLDLPAAVTLTTVQWLTPLNTPTNSIVFLLRAFIKLKQVLVDLFRQHKGSYELKDTGLIVASEMVRLFGNAFIAAVGAPDFPLLNSLVADAIAEGSPEPANVGATTFLAAETSTTVTKFVPLLVRVAVVELRLALDDVMLCPPDRALSELTAKRLPWLVGACCHIAEQAISTLVVADDPKAYEQPEDTTLLPRSGPTTVRLPLAYFQHMVGYTVTHLPSSDIATWFTHLKDAFRAIVEFLEDRQSRGHSTLQLLTTPEPVAAFRSLCCWLAQDVTLLQEKPDLVQLVGHVIETCAVHADAVSAVLPLMVPVVQHWESIAPKADKEPWTTEMVQQLHAMTQTLNTLLGPGWNA